MNARIIIPTYNSPKYLQRVLEYYQVQGTKLPITVADSSRAETKLENKKIVKATSGLEITYQGNYDPELTSHHKFAKAIARVREKYVVFCADDDFVIPRGITQAIKFLDQQPDFACAHGAYIRFRENKSRAFQWRPLYGARSLENTEEWTRLKEHFENYTPTFFAVHRTSVLKKSYAALMKSGIDPRAFGELLPSVLTVLSGKVKRLPGLYAARDEGSNARFGRWPSLLDFMKEGTFEENYKKFKSSIAEQTKTNLDVVNQRIDADIEPFLAHGITTPKAKAMNTALRFLERLPKPINRGVRAAYRGVKARTASAVAWQSVQAYAPADQLELAAVENIVLNARGAV